MYLKSYNLDSIERVFSKTQEQYNYKHSVQRVNDIWKNRGGFFSLSWEKQTMKLENAVVTETGASLKNLEWESKWAVSLMWGRQYYICPTKPIAKLLEFAIDYTWIDLNAAQYGEPLFTGIVSTNGPQWSTTSSTSKQLSSSASLYHFEYGMSLGASLTINPISFLKLSAYYHFTPSLSVTWYDKSTWSFAYANNMSFGVSIAYKVISFGWEMRWGTCQMKNIIATSQYKGWQEGIDQNKFNSFAEVLSSGQKLPMRTDSNRFYISFRF